MEKINSGEYKPGSKIPTEKEFCELFSVSRMTVSHAVQSIVSLGMLSTKRGYGTTVTSTAMERKITDLTSFTEELIRKGMNPVTEVLEYEKVAEGMEWVQQKFVVPPDTPIHKIVRRRSDGDIPIAIDNTFVNGNVIEQIDEAYLCGSFYSYLEKVLGVKISHSTFEIVPIRAGRQISELLSVEYGLPLIKQTHLTYDINGNPFEYCETTYNPSKYRFSGVSYRKDY